MVICGIIFLAFTCGHVLMSQSYKEMSKYLKQSKQLPVNSKKSKFHFSNNSGSRNLFPVNTADFDFSVTRWLLKIH